ncbi:ROK family transcriptional regulator [Alkalihalobacillus sp. TS-13]|uniref:ROK family transcriptional regulator n=1 Tax=Alkalihalobacillus sp. TS-13 TaxID=2842455 RepID=UPI001C882707|nr:ROK family transcriptional regulator [Alkalihalobacillus sp. TS-13]
MTTGDATYIKALNRRILIEKIFEHGSISRSELARLTGLNKSTVSAQISDMMTENLVIERPSEISSGGRKPILLQMNGEAGYSIGVDLDEHLIQIQVTNLLGKPLFSHDIETTQKDATTALRNIVEALSEIIGKCEGQYKPVGLVGIGVGVHGIVANEHKVIFTPKLRWIDVNIKKELEDLFNVPVYVNNNANLCAYAEQVYNYSITDLFCLTMYSGIGLGILKDNEIYRGYQGFAGEIGHMIIEGNGLQCPCGNQGCWEQYASEKALKQQLIDEGLLISEFDELDIDVLFKNHQYLIEKFFDDVAIGLNNIINIFNPGTIIINSQLLNLNPELINQLEDRLISRMNNYHEIVSSTLGKRACSLGASMIALKNYFSIHTLNLRKYNYFEVQR